MLQKLAVSECGTTALRCVDADEVSQDEVLRGTCISVDYICVWHHDLLRQSSAGTWCTLSPVHNVWHTSASVCTCMENKRHLLKKLFTWYTYDEDMFGRDEKLCIHIYNNFDIYTTILGIWLWYPIYRIPDLDLRTNRTHFTTCKLGTKHIRSTIYAAHIDCRWLMSPVPLNSCIRSHICTWTWDSEEESFDGIFIITSYIYIRTWDRTRR